ncbi:hypothetical protein AAKU67_000931 [Oxalobacteraceae bacterium GrIS 2.11]
MQTDITLFVGPTLFGTGIRPETYPNITFKPPVRRGDIAQLAQDESPGIIGIVDGTFHAFPSVSHVELREAMEQGWRIFGLCSMGAIRAAEMQHMGLRPWGKVADIFCSNPDFADDEVTLVHSVDAPFVPLSEPLIHIREFLSQMYLQQEIAESEYRNVLDFMHQQWYGTRTLRVLQDRLLATLRLDKLTPVLADALSNFQSYRIKQTDLLQFVHSKPWLAA